MVRIFIQTKFSGWGKGPMDAHGKKLDAKVFLKAGGLATLTED
jgi:hypothetical protein